MTSIIERRGRMFSQLKIHEFIDILASKRPTPGGGSASALTGAVGIALLSMAANLTIGKEKYKQEEDFIKQLLEEVENRKSLMSLIDEIPKHLTWYLMYLRCRRLPTLKNVKENTLYKRL